MSAWKYPPRRQTRKFPISLRNLWLASIGGILITVFLVALVSAAMPSFTDWVEANSVHPDCPTYRC